MMSSVFKEQPVLMLVSEGTTIQGDIALSCSGSIYGAVEGALSQDSLEVLHIGKTGWVRGEIISKGPVLIEGRVEGDISSSIQIRLAATASVRGKLSAPHIEVQPGACLDGELAIKKPHKAASPNRTPQDKEEKTAKVTRLEKTTRIKKAA